MPDLCTLDQVKAWLNLTGLSTADILLTRLVSAVSADFLNAIERYDFTPPADFTDVHTIEAHNLTRLSPERSAVYSSGPLQSEFRVGLNHWPVNSIASVSLDGVAVAASADGIAPGWYIDLKEQPEFRNTLIVIGQYVRQGYSKLSVTYNAGYASNAVPAEVTQAVIEWVAFRYRVRDSLGKQSVHMQQGESITFDKTAMPASVQNVIERYSVSAVTNF
jgi:hypothetical protein